MGRSKIFPQLKTIDYIHKGEGNLIYKPLMSNLIVCFVEDTGENLVYFNKQKLEEIRLNTEELYNLALKNLIALDNTEKGSHIMDQQDGTKAISYETNDSYDAARFLLLFKSKLDFFIETLGDPFLVAIPCRDFLLAVPQSYENKLASYAKQLFNEKPFPLTTELFMFSKKESTFTNTNT